MFQKSYQQSKLSSEWKYANVIPVFKGKGNRHTVENYRPISLMCTICKVMDSILYDLITEHCDNNIIINTAQYGFRNKHSTITNLLELLNDITKAVDEKNKTDVITIDFSKAFD